MKYIVIVSFLFSCSAFAKNISWETLQLKEVYKINKSITLHRDDKIIIIPKNTRLTLYEISNLSMIKVHLHKYKIEKCPALGVETDLELIPVKQENNIKTSVGVNLTKNCSLEIFIDMKEYDTNSFLI